MDEKRVQKALEYISDSIDTGYSALFTFAVKEFLTTSEKKELASMLREAKVTQAPDEDSLLQTKNFHPNESELQIRNH